MRLTSVVHVQKSPLQVPPGPQESTPALQQWVLGMHAPPQSLLPALHAVHADAEVHAEQVSGQLVQPGALTKNPALQAEGGGKNARGKVKGCRLRPGVTWSWAWHCLRSCYSCRDGALPGPFPPLTCTRCTMPRRLRTFCTLEWCIARSGGRGRDTRV